MRKTVYADNAATTALSKTAFEAMLPYLTTEYGNPASVYSFGRNAKRAIQTAREKIASAIGALPEEINFTSGGTKADNQLAHSSLRFSLNEDNSEKDVDYILEKLPAIISRLRDFSPVWNTIKAEAK